MILLAAIYYLAVGGNFGDGSSASSPIDCSTAKKFDAFMRGKYLARETDDTFHLGPGTFYTRRYRDITVAGKGGKQWNGGDYNWANWNLLAGWKFFGAGMNQTTVKLVPIAFYPKDPSIQNDGIHLGMPASVLARATSAISSGAVTSVTLTHNGTGYGVSYQGDQVPIRFHGGGGKGAAAEITGISKGHITGIKVTSGGSGYRSAPTVDIGVLTWKGNLNGDVGPGSATAKCAYGGTVFFGEPWDLPGQEIHDLTVDCSWSDFGCRVVRPWKVPAVDSSVTVTVENGKKFTKGKYVFLHHTAPGLYDRRKPIGTFEVASVKGNRVRIINRQDLMGENSADSRWKFEQPGTSIPAGCLMAPRQNTCGIDLSANGCKVIKVRVTNTGSPIYEGQSSIGFDYGNALNATGGYCQINNNVVDTTWGTCGWGITSLVNNYSGHATARVIGEVLNNSYYGNGYDRGGIGNADVTYRGNYYKNCVLYCDTGFTTNVLFENNVIDGGSVGFLSGYKNPDGSPGFAGWTFRNNTIKLLIGEHAFWALGGLKNWKIVNNDLSVHPDFAAWGLWHKSRAFCFQTPVGRIVNTQVVGNRETGFANADIGLDLCITKPGVPQKPAIPPADVSN